MSKEALKLALEALDNLLYWDNGKSDYDQAREAITAIKQALAAQPAPVQEPDRVRECAQRLVEHADFRLGGVLSADSKAKDIPSKAVSQVKARHLASLRDALAATPLAAPVQEPLRELEKDAANLLFALHDAWPYVHQHCTIQSKKNFIQALIVKHGDFADLQPPTAQPAPIPENFMDALRFDVAMRDAALVQKPVAWRWHQAPVKTSWGHEMVVADLAIDKDNTVSVYCERDQIVKVEAMFNSPAAQRQWVGLCDTDIGDEYVRFEIQGGFNRFEYAVRAIEAKLKEKNNG
jgi:hypothetical protein